MFKRWLFSDTLLALSRAKQLAYIGVVTAITVVANTFFEFKLADVQFSLTILFSVLSGFSDKYQIASR